MIRSAPRSPGAAATGRGAVDMNRGLPVIAAAAQAPAQLRAAARAITNDEEADGINGTDRILEWAAAQGHI